MLSVTLPLPSAESSRLAAPLLLRPLLVPDAPLLSCELSREVLPCPGAELRGALNPARPAGADDLVVVVVALVVVVPVAVALLAAGVAQCREGPRGGRVDEEVV